MQKRRRVSRGTITAAVAVVVTLGASIGGVFAVRAKQAPAHFSQGGAFVRGVDTTAPAIDAARGGDELDPATTAVGPDTSAASPSTAATGTAGPTGSSSASTGGGGARAVGTGRSGSRTTTTVRTGTAATTLPSNHVAAADGVRVTPARGTWTYAVKGSEAVTGYGSRDLPDRMQTQVHGDAGIPADASVLDVTYSSDHQERQIVRWTDAGWIMTFEGGKVSFGAASQSNSSTYVPAMTQVAAPLKAGQTAKGTSEVRADDGSVDRVEDWVSTVVGQEAVDVSGTSVPAWKVTLTRRSRPGGSQDVTRDRTYWFAPSLGMPVKYTEHFKGTQKVVGFDFAFSDDLTATLLTHP